jgi:hypothetical protein
MEMQNMAMARAELRTMISFTPSPLISEVVMQFAAAGRSLSSLLAIQPRRMALESA